MVIYNFDSPYFSLDANDSLESLVIHKNYSKWGGIEKIRVK